MLITPSHILQAVLFAFGLAWCGAMLRRWRSDLEDFRSTEDRHARAAIGVAWLVTGGVALMVGGFALKLAGRIGLV